MTIYTITFTDARLGEKISVYFKDKHDFEAKRGLVGNHLGQDFILNVGNELNRCAVNLRFYSYAWFSEQEMSDNFIGTEE